MAKKEVRRYRISASDTIKDRYDVEKEIYWDTHYWQTVKVAVTYEVAKAYVDKRLEAEAWAKSQKVEVYPPEPEPTISKKEWGFYGGVLFGAVGMVFFAVVFGLIHG